MINIWLEFEQYLKEEKNDRTKDCTSMAAYQFYLKMREIKAAYDCKSLDEAGY